MCARIVGSGAAMWLSRTAANVASFPMAQTMQDHDCGCNPSPAPRFDEICERRRRFLGGVAGAAIALGGLPLAGCATSPATARAKPASPTFKSIPVSTADRVIVPEGYEAYVLYAWGDPI